MSPRSSSAPEPRRRTAPTGELGPDGQWRVTPSGAADFTTRVVALTPADRSQFNGTVLVEWLNVSGGIDAPAVWMMAHREIVRAGYAYVAVSAQKVGVDGGASLLGIDMSLKSQDPTRYASLNHPGDAFAFDIFSQVGGLIRSRRRHPRRTAPATRRRPRRVPVGDVPHHLHQRRRSARPRSTTASWCIPDSDRPPRWTAAP